MSSTGPLFPSCNLTNLTSCCQSVTFTSCVSIQGCIPRTPQWLTKASLPIDHEQVFGKWGREVPAAFQGLTKAWIKLPSNLNGCSSSSWNKTQRQNIKDMQALKLFSCSHVHAKIPVTQNALWDRLVSKWSNLKIQEMKAVFEGTNVMHYLQRSLKSMQLWTETQLINSNQLWIHGSAELF